MPGLDGPIQNQYGATAQPGSYLIHSGLVLDPEHDRAPFLADIEVADGRIAGVHRHESPVGSSARRSAGSIDAAGKLVIPGFVNAHYHSSDNLLKGRFEATFLEDWMLHALPMRYGPRSTEELYVRTVLGAVDALSHGITTVQDMVGFVPSTPQAVAAVLRAYQDVGIRVVLAPQFADRGPLDSVPGWRERIPPHLTHLLHPPPGRADPAQLSVSSFLDLIAHEVSTSSPHSRVSWGIALSGRERASSELVSTVSDWRREHGLRLYAHAAISHAEWVQAQREFDGSVIAHLDRARVLGPDTTLAHCVWIDDRDAEILARTGTFVVHNPASNLKARNGVAPVHRWYERGVRVALGCDNSSCGDSQNMFSVMRLHALLPGLAGTTLEHPDAWDALRAATSGGAAALGLADGVGRILPGYAADLVLLDLADTAYLPLNDPARQLVFAESGRGVDTVIVAGDVVSRRGHSTKFSPQGIASLLREVMPAVDRDAIAVAAEAAQLREHVWATESGFWADWAGPSRSQNRSTPKPTLIPAVRQSDDCGGMGGHAGRAGR